LGEAFFRTLQLKLPEREQKILKGYKSKFNKTCFIIAAYVSPIGDGDAYIVNVGDNNMGKTTFGIRVGKRIAYFLRKYFSIDAHFLMDRDIWFMPSVKNIRDLQRKDSAYNIKLVDDGYFLGLNLDFNVSLAKETTKVAMGTRGHHNVMIMNFQRPTRATKTLLERFKIMFFKPTIKDAVLLCRSALSVLSEDVWGLDPILKAKNDKIRLRRLKRNQHYIVGLPYKKLPDWEYKDYKNLQNNALDARAKSQSHESEAESDYRSLAEEFYERISKGNYAYADMQKELRNPSGYGFNDGMMRSFTAYYNRFAASHQIRKMKSQREGNSEDT
jgi:hypothetical protein